MLLGLFLGWLFAEFDCLGGRRCRDALRPDRVLTLGHDLAAGVPRASGRLACENLLRAGLNGCLVIRAASRTTSSHAV